MDMGKNYSKLLENIQPLGEIISYIDENINLSNWMSQLPEEVYHIPITKLAIPGSHNSMTYSISKFGQMSPDVSFLFNKPIPICLRPWIYKWCKTQDHLIINQLENGIRYLDVRVSSKKGSDGLYIVHGMYGGDVLKELEGVNDFLNAHLGEIVIIDFQHFYAMTNNDHDRLTNGIKNIFRNKICPLPTSSIQNATLGYMYANHYQVIVIYRNRDYNQFWGGYTWPTHWPATMSPKEMIRVCENAVLKRTCVVGLVSQGVLTAKKSTTLSPTGNVKNSCAEKALIPILEWLNHCYVDNLPVNVVIADYVHYEDNLFTKGVISLNYRLDKLC